MPAKQRLYFEQLIIDCLKTNYGLKVVALRFLPLGADPNASVYKAETRDRSAYFVKIKKGHHHDISVDILGLLSSAGIQDIILPIKTIHGRPTERIDDFTVVVYPFIEGQDGFNRTLTDDQWIRLGKTLRQVHELVIPPSIEKRVRHETYSPKWREVVRSFHLDSALIHRLVDHAEYLAENLQNQSTKFVLCHSDIHGGNVLIGPHDAMYVVYWDDPIMAPKERDLMFIGGGVGNVWNQPREEELFYQGYGKTEIDKRLLAYYRNERIVEDIAFYCQGNREEMDKHFKDMFEPRGVVDIAFETMDLVVNVSRCARTPE